MKLAQLKKKTKMTFQLKKLNQEHFSLAKERTDRLQEQE